MTRPELIKLKEVLTRIKDPDGHVKECIANADRDLARREQQRTNFRDYYEADFPRY